MFFRESAAERHGISQTDFLGKPWQELGFPATFMASFTTQLQAAIKAALQDAPYTLIGVQDPLTVMELAQELHPCAITLDVMMPQLNGWQLVPRNCQSFQELS